jgi:hypothetical protein
MRGIGTVGVEIVIFDVTFDEILFDVMVSFFL